MNERKIISYMGFARKARRLTAGTEACRAGLDKKEIKIIVLAGDVAENTADKWHTLAERAGVPLVVVGTIESLSQATGNFNRGIYGVTDKELAQAISRAAQGEERK